MTEKGPFHYFNFFPIFNARRHFESTKSPCQKLLLHKAKNTPRVTLEIDHPFSHSVRLPKINEWAAEGKWLTRTSHRSADPNLLKFCLPNAKLNISFLHSVYILLKSPLSFLHSMLLPQRGNDSEVQRKAASYCFQQMGGYNESFPDSNYKTSSMKTQDSECWVAFMPQY